MSRGFARSDPAENATVDDPHVITLRYRIEPGAAVTFDDPPPIAWDTDLFAARLEGGQLIVSPKDHHATAEAARAAVDGYIRGWEFESDLRWGRGEIRFIYEAAEIVDRNPSPARTEATARVEVVLVGLTLTGKVTAHLTRRSYPPPPSPALNLTPDVETLQRRFDGYLDGREPLPAMAFFCLSYLENYLAGSRDEAADRYQIHRKVLDKLGELSSNRWDSSIARKVGTKDGAPRLVPFQPHELRWLELAIKRIIYRVAERSSNPELILAQITLQDLPPLSE